MKKDMDRVNDDLKNRYIEGQSGGGLITVTVNGQQEVVKISVDPKALQVSDDGQVDLEMFEDLLIAAINQAVSKSKDMMNEEMNNATGGLSAGLPGLF